MWFAEASECLHVPSSSQSDFLDQPLMARAHYRGQCLGALYCLPNAIQLHLLNHITDKILGLNAPSV